MKEIHSVGQQDRINSTMNSSVLQNQRNKKKHTFSIAVSLRAVTLAFFPNTHMINGLSQRRNRRQITDGFLLGDGSSLNVCIVFSGAEVWTVFFFTKRRLLSPHAVNYPYS